MARGKHAATLFEVFQKGKRADGPTSWSIPKWFNWSTVKPASAPVRPTMKMTAPVKRAAAPLPKPPPPVTARSQALAGPTWIDYLRDWLEENKRTALPSLIGAAAAIVLIALVLLFRHSAGASGVPGMPGLKSTAELRRGPAHPEVLDVTGATRAAWPQDPRSAVDNQVPTVPAVTPVNPEAAIPATNALPPLQRQKDLNYVVVQSYGDEKTANEARDFLIGNNIPCTVEHGLPGWRKDFYYVVGLDGFVRTSTPDLLAYKTRIETLSVKFAPKGSYKAFRPMAIKWK